MKTVFLAERHCLLYNTHTTLGLAECFRGAEKIIAAAKADVWTMHNEWNKANPVAAAGRGLERYEWNIEEQEVEPCTHS
jgi:hypothetical protein